MMIAEEQVIDFAVTLKTINCGKCGGTYALNKRYLEKKQEEGGTWNCPYCRIGWGYVTSENERLTRELAQKQKRLEWEEQATKRAREEAELWRLKERGQRAAKSRIKNRVAKGVCPCCKRSFGNLGRHMATVHPNYAASED